MVVVTNKVTGSSSTVGGNNIVLTAPSVVKLSLSPRAIADYQKIGDDLVIRLHNGETIRIVHFYAHHPNGGDSDLVLEDSDGKLWVGQHSDGLADFNFAEIQSVDQLVGGATGGVSPVLLGLLGIGAAAGIIAAASGSGDDDGDDGIGVDRDPPGTLVVALENDTGLPGDGITSDGTVIVDGLEEGATWQYSTDGGRTWHDGNGASFELEPGAYGDGDILVRQIDSAGNVGPATPLGPVTIDLTPPTTTVELTDPDGDNIPTASGVTEPGSTVVVSWPDGTTSTVTADGTTGAWTASPSTPQADGTVTVTVTDPAGNAGTDTGTWTSDTTPPDTGAAGTTVTVGAIAGDNIVNAAEAAGNVAVTVTVANAPADAATTTVTVLVDGVPYAAVANGDGTWTAQVPGSALAGATTPTVTAEAVFADAAGNDAAPVTGTQTYTVDTDIPALLTADLENDTGTPGDGITNDGTVVVGGLEAGASWEYSTDGGATWQTGSGTSFELAPGIYADGDVQVRQTDAAGNTSPAGSLGPVTIDLTPPTTTVELTDPDGDNIPTASGVTEPGSTVVVSWPDGTTSTVTADGTTGAWTASPSTPQGDGTVTVTVTDPAGNAGTDTGTWTSDTTPPDTGAAGTTVTVGAIAGDNIVNAAEAAGNVAVTVTVANAPADAATTTVTVLVDGVPYAAVANGDGTWTAQVPGSALAGATTPTVTAEAVFADAAGNDAAPVTGTQTYTVDTDIPASLTADLENDTGTPGDGITNDGTVVVGGLEAGASWEYSTDGGATWQAGSGTSFELAPGTYADGDVQVRQTDAAGNTSPAGSLGPVTIDLTPPTTTVELTDPDGDNIPTASGVTEPGSTVVVSWPDGTTSTVTADGTTGAWTASPSTPQADGTVTVTVTDPAGNAGTDTGTWTSDTTPPDTGAAGTTVTVGAIAGDNIVNAAEAAGNVAVTVTVADAPADAATTTVTVLVDGVPYAAVANGDGTWTAQVPGSALAGATTPTVTAEAVFADAAGNDAAPVTGTQTYTVDTDIPASLTADLENDTGTPGDGITNDGTVVVGGLEAGASWEYSTDGGATWQAGSGTSFELAPGTYADGDVQVRQTDAAGNTSPAGSLGPVTIDLTPPTTTVELTDPDGDNIPTASGVTEPGSTVVVSWPDGTTSTVTADGTTGAWTASPSTPQADGTVTVTVTDPAGNAGTDTGTWTSDTTPPDTGAAGTTVTVGAIAGDNIVNAAEAAGNVAVTVTVANAPADAATTTVTVLVDGVPYAAVANGDGTWTAQVPGSALAGATTPTVTAEAVFADAAGNDAAPVTGTQTYTVDTDIPASLTADLENDTGTPGDGITNDGTVVVGGLEAGASWEYSTDGGATWQAGSGTSFELAPGTYADGDVQVRQTDAAGNTSPAGSLGPVTIDLTPPTTTVELTDPDGDNIPTASGVTEPGSTVVVSWPDGTTSTVTADGTTGAWTASPSTPQADGTVTVTVTDPAGNAGTDTGTWTSDTTPPDTGAAGTTVTVGAIAGDNIVNAAEAAGNVAVTVTVADAPADAATTTVTVLVDGVPYAAVANGDGTWTAQVPGSALAGATTPTVTAEAVFADAAGNDAAPVTGTQTYTVDTDIPASLTADLENDTGTPGDGITNDGTVVVGGLEAGASWEYSTDGGATWQAGSGTSFELAPGTYADGDVQVRQTDAAGNTSPAGSLGPVTIDLTPPTTTVELTDPDGDNIPTASGVTEPGSTVVVSWPDGTTSTVTADGTTGAWTASPSTPQADGTVTVTVTDPAGNAGTDTGTWTSDTTPPDTGAAGTTVTVGAIAGDNIVNAAEAAGNVAVTVTVANAPADAATTTVTVLVDGVPYAAVANGDGTWTAQVPGSALAGATTPTVTAEAVFADAAGNDAAPVTGTQTYTVDTDIPASLTADLENDTGTPGDGITNDGTVVVGGLEAGASWEYSTDGGATWQAGSGTSFELAPGTYADGDVQVRQTDAAGNTSPAGSLGPVTIDLTPPTTTVELTDPDGDNIPTASGVTEPGSTVVVSWPDGTTSTVTADGTTGAWTASPSTPQADGTVTVTVTDPAGNAGTDTGTWTSDTTPPDTGAAGTTVTVGAIAGDNIVNAAEAAGNVAVTVTVANAPADAATTTVTVLVDGVPYAAVANGDGTWTAQVPGSVLAGATTPTVTAEAVFADAAGNDAAPVTDTQNYTVDVTPPTTTIDLTDPEGDNIPTASGVTEPGSTVVVTWPDGTSSTVTADGTTGAWTATPVLAQPDGTVSVAVTDPAGNPGTGSAGWTPNTTTPGAADDLATASVDIVPAETAVNNGSATYALGIGIGLGLIDLQATVLGVPSVGFTIADGHTQDLTFAFGGLANVGVLGDYQVIVQKWDALTGQWTSIDGSATGGSILNIGLLDGGANGVAIPDMDPGQYRAFMVYNGIGLSVLTTMTVNGLDHDYLNTSIETGEATGNVLDNDGGAAAAGHIVTSVNFNGTDYPVAAGPAGTTIIGQYGQLVIHQDGSYTYTPNADAAAIGKVDQFTYTLHDPVANTDTQAELYVRIDSDGQGLVWSDTDIGADATYSVAATNDAADLSVTWINPTDPLLDQSQSLGGLFGDNTANSNSFIIGANEAASGTVTVSVTVGAVSSGTVGLQELVGGVWQDVPNSAISFNITVGLLGTVATIDIGSLGLDAGTYRVHTTLSSLLTSMTVTTDVNVTHLDQHVISGDPSISGSVVVNDGIVPEGSKVMVADGGAFVDATTAGTVIHGLHGDLTIYSDGTYKYEPLDTLAYADREATDSFTYKIVLPSGYETTAELVVQLHDGSAVAFANVTGDPVSAESFSMDPSGDVVPLHSLAEHNASDAPPEPAQHDFSEALVLDDGGGEIVLPSSDSETVGGSSADVAASSTDTDLLTVDDSSAVTDPLAYLTPDPLTQEDPLHSAHMV